MDCPLFTNYRPISLLPVLSKLLEKVVHKRLYSYLLKHQILYESQYGFRESHSTTNAISELTAHILESFDERKIAICTNPSTFRGSTSLNKDNIDYD